jgi:hypothetical protein
MNDLSDTKIRNARSADREYTIANGAGLSIVVRPNGTKLWLYRFGGKRKNMSFGTFPAVGLKAAREKRHEAEKLRDQGQDPAAAREVRRQENERARHTFRAAGQEWLTTKLEKENKAKATIKRETWNLGQLYREIGDKKLCEIEPPDLLAASQSGGVLGAVKDKPCRARKRASLTAPARAAVEIARVGTEKRASSRTKKPTWRADPAEMTVA